MFTHRIAGAGPSSVCRAKRVYNHGIGNLFRQLESTSMALMPPVSGDQWHDGAVFCGQRGRFWRPVEPVNTTPANAGCGDQRGTDGFAGAVSQLQRAWHACGNHQFDGLKCHARRLFGLAMTALVASAAATRP
jgi:hypothetical protein